MRVLDRSTPLAPTGRFAPSPTGPLHPGSLLAALGSWLLARRAGGRWLVRMEDLDPPREVPGAAAGQLAALEAFGLVADGPVAYQSRRHALYQAAMDALLARGDAFPCHCSRADLAAEGGIHRACVPGARRPDPAIRLRVADGTQVAFDDLLQGPMAQDVGREAGDFVLRRSDGLWAYQLAVVVDDAEQGITDIVRGADLLDSTPRQIHLQRLLGLPVPRHAHLPLLVDGEGRKLSKSQAALPVDPRHPLPALRAAWRGLGQDASALDGATEAHGLLRLALRAFDTARMPRVRQLPLAALHNGDPRRAD